MPAVARQQLRPGRRRHRRSACRPTALDQQDVLGHAAVSAARGYGSAAQDAATRCPVARRELRVTEFRGLVCAARATSWTQAILVPSGVTIVLKPFRMVGPRAN